MNFATVCFVPAGPLTGNRALSSGANTHASASICSPSTNGAQMSSRRSARSAAAVTFQCSTPQTATSILLTSTFHGQILGSKSRNSPVWSIHTRDLPLIRAEEKSTEGPSAEEDDVPVPFWDTRTGVLVIGGLVLFGGVGVYYGLQATGLDAIQAGIYTQMVVAGGILVAWCGSYLFKWATSDLAYFKQRKRYEDAVIRKRYDELTDEQWTKMVLAMEEEEKQRKGDGENKKKAKKTA